MPRKGKKYHYIYKTTNLINGKFYVGMHSTDDLNDGYLGSGKRLRYSINKYGRENFKIEFLEFFESRKLLVEREKNLVNEELLHDVLCMNLKPGGSGGLSDKNHLKKFTEAGGKATKDKWLDDNFKTSWNEKHLSRFSEQMKGKIKEGKIKRVDWTGKKHKQDSKIKMSISASKRIGNKNSQFRTCWICNVNEVKKIKIDLLESYIKNGWKKGRKY